MATAIEQLRAMHGLADNWDGYGAAAPQPNALELAQEFVGFIEAMLRHNGTAATVLHVSPTRVGGVLIDWQDPAREHEIEIDPDGSIGFLHLDKGTGQIETRKFSPGSAGVVQRGLLDELCQTLAA